MIKIGMNCGKRFRDPLEDAESFIIDDKKLANKSWKEKPDYDEIHGQYMGIIKITKEDLKSFLKNLLKK